MNRRVVIRIVLITGLLAYWYFFRPQDESPRPLPPEVSIEDGKTIDFSKGKAEVRNTAEDQAAMDAAVKEMEEATKDISFGPAPKQP